MVEDYLNFVIDIQHTRMREFWKIMIFQSKYGFFLIDFSVKIKSIVLKKIHMTCLYREFMFVNVFSKIIHCQIKLNVHCLSISSSKLEKLSGMSMTRLFPISKGYPYFSKSELLVVNCEVGDSYVLFQKADAR
jgi:hypothetical protein